MATERPLPPLEKPRVLVVDDKLEMAEMVADGLADRGYQTVALASSREAVERLRTETFAALVTDLRMPDVDGMELLAASRASDPERPVLVMTAYGAIDSAMESIRKGAYHYFTKPFKVEELALFLGRALEQRALRQEARELRREAQTRRVVGSGGAMRAVLDIVDRVAPTDVPVLLLGETGTGKGLLAQVIHGASTRAARRLVSVNCAALPENLLESELFGHVKGAFTGASSASPGLFSEASGGTLFLDEIAEMTPALQAKLLHVLESGLVRPVGAGQDRAVDVRIVAATHRDLRERIRAGAFREDLLYRLEVMTLELPALRQRRDDLPELLGHFLAVARAKHPSSKVESLSSAAARMLLEYRWPGNVRELQHLLERLVLLGKSPEISVEELPPGIRNPLSADRLSFTGDVVTVRELHARYAAWALGVLGGQRKRTAEVLDVDAKTLRSWLSVDED